MTDKDLLVVVSEMLRKQDQQSEKLDEHSTILNQHTGILKQHTEILIQNTGLIKETNNTLKQFMEVSIQQFQQQQAFNERFFSKLEDIEKSLKK